MTKPAANRELTDRIKEQARGFGADLIGIAPRERFADLPPDKSPLSIFPEMTAMIVLGRRVLRGAMRGIEEGTNFGSTYGCFGFRWLEDNFLSKTTYDLNIFIESQGFEAVPMFAYFEDGMPKGKPVAAGKPAPNVIVDPHFAALAAGLGEIGLGDFFLTPQYGTRQRFAMLLTDAPLVADPLPARTLCSACGACAKACPFGAIDCSRTHNAGLPGQTMPVAAIDNAVCRACPNGAMKGPGRGDRPDRLAAACGRACLVHLEQNGKCANKFEQAFRKRAAWALDTFQRPVDVNADGSVANAKR